MKVLFIGGTGVISSACSELCIEKGMELHVIVRGLSMRKPPEGARVLTCDIRDTDRVRSLTAGGAYDTVVDWIAYTPEDIERDHGLFRGCLGQYVFISSASVYRRPPSRLPVAETEALENRFWKYSQDKIRSENLLRHLSARESFPWTIVRPSHTYDRTKFPLHGGPTALGRLLEGRQLIIHGDGSTLWTLTHHKDFARGFVGLLGKSSAIGEAYHITSDEALSWNEIARTLGRAAGAEPRIVHIPSEFIRGYDREWGDGLLGDKAYSMVFDNSRIRAINPEFSPAIPFREGAKEIISWYREDISRLRVDPVLDRRMDEIIAAYSSSSRRSLPPL